MRKDTSHLKSNIDLLYEQADTVNFKIKTGTATAGDYILLLNLSETFSSRNKHPESSFCKKLQVKFLLQAYQNNAAINNIVEDLEVIHDLAIDLLMYAENKRVISASIYKVFLQVKVELANAKLVQGFYEDAEALQKCGERIYRKALRLFPTYTKFPTPISYLQIIENF